MGIFDELDKKKSSTKKSSSGIFAELDKQKEKAAKIAAVPAEKELLRSQGKAVSTRSDRATPTFGGEILRGIAKPAVTLMARPAQLTAALMGWDENQQTLKSGYLGDIKTSKSGKDVVKDVGRGLELVSNAVGVGALRNVGRNAVKQGAIQVAKRAGIEGLAAGFIQGVGSGISEGKTGKDLLWNAAKSTGFGGLGGFLVGGAGAKLMGTKTPEKLAQQAEEAANMRALKKYGEQTIPGVGVPDANYRDPKTLRLPAPRPKTDFFVGEKGVSTNPKEARVGVKQLTPEQIERNIKVQYEPYIPEDKLPVITAKDVKTPAKNEFRANVQYDPSTGVPVKESKASPLKTITDTATPTAEKKYYTNSYGKKIEIKTPSTISENVPNDVATKGSIPTVSTEIPTLPQDKTLTPKGTVVPKVTVGEPIKVPKAKVEKQNKILNDLVKEETGSGYNPDDFSSQVKENSRNFYNEDPERAFNVIQGKEPIPTGVNLKALYKLAKMDATGEQAVRLAELRGISSKTGQDLSMLNQAGENNGITDKIIEVNDYFKGKMDKKAYKQTMDDLANHIRENKPTMEELNKLIDEFDIC